MSSLRRCWCRLSSVLLEHRNNFLTTFTDTSDKVNIIMIHTSFSMNFLVSIIIVCSMLKDLWTHLTLVPVRMFFLFLHNGTFGRTQGRLGVTFL